MSASRPHETWSELAVRENDGLAVSLLWSKATGRTRVVVVDQMFETELHVDVPPTCALDAYYHPYVYAAGRGDLDCDCAHGQTSISNRPEGSAAR